MAAPGVAAWRCRSVTCRARALRFSRAGVGNVGVPAASAALGRRQRRPGAAEASARRASVGGDRAADGRTRRGQRGCGAARRGHGHAHANPALGLPGPADRRSPRARRRARARAAGGVEHANALGLGRRPARRIRRRSRAKNCVALALQPVGQTRRARPARATAAGRDRQQQRRVGLQVAGGEAVDLAHLLDPEPAPGALVGRARSRRSGRAARSALVEQRRAALLDELRARSRVQKRLGARRHGQRRILDQRANALGDLHAAGLAQQPHVRARARPVALEHASAAWSCRRRRALDRDQPAAGSRLGTLLRAASLGSAAMAAATTRQQASHGASAGDELRRAPAGHRRASTRARGARAGAAREASAVARLPVHGPVGHGQAEIARAFAAALLAEASTSRPGVRERIERGSHPT